MYGLGTALRGLLFSLWGTTVATSVGPVEGPMLEEPPAHEAAAVAMPLVGSEQAAAPGTMPSVWLPDIRRCYRSPRSYCNGPRRVPRPLGREGMLGQSLGLGTLAVAHHLLMRRGLPEWIAAAGPATAEDMLWPVEGGNFMRGFGFVRRNRPDLQHDGVDITAPIGTPIRAVNDGIVAYADNEVHGYGNLLLIVHGDGTTSLYAHLRAAYVFPGQHVTRGQTIAEIGVTGLSHGPHLHFEWHLGGRPRNPWRRFAERPEHHVRRVAVASR